MSKKKVVKPAPPLQALPADANDPAVARQIAMSEAAARGDTVEFERLRDQA